MMFIYKNIIRWSSINQKKIVRRLVQCHSEIHVLGILEMTSMTDVGHRYKGMMITFRYEISFLGQMSPFLPLGKTRQHFNIR